LEDDNLPGRAEHHRHDSTDGLNGPINRLAFQAYCEAGDGARTQPWRHRGDGQSLKPQRPCGAPSHRSIGARLLYLPPYSPDFNPIENAFAKLKALLRKVAEPTFDGLWDAIGHIIDLFTPSECANYFAAAGYEPD
jgi:hypothetical protein